jgi:NDP-sugar pyrophosphorylase family protein
VIAVGYRADLIETYFGDGSRLGVHIEYCREAEPLGTAGPLALIRTQFGATSKPDDSLFVMNGDLLTELDVPALIDFHERGGQEITVVTRDYELRHPYGVIDLDGDRITRIVEKPAVTERVNAGIYVLRWAALDLIPEGAPYQMPDLLNSAIAKGYQVVSYPFAGTWLAIDRVEQLIGSTSIVGQQDS